ncbi:glutathione synthetase ATP-binding domain-like protein [Karstenula rhodostoma CBS 690.94]|uniref:Glutathione synthetase ATP-binding domain-like protein n=1 Tax=Karstenula rhodostoma CBS 690.94 TaxID=1392251 RepID=A0A9P4PTF2_9PLEO|nr:glutathione synthetase ATP-binding domain-like protein [Karstenula rhodostoma CBS 690.94]
MWALSRSYQIPPTRVSRLFARPCRSFSTSAHLARSEHHTGTTRPRVAVLYQELDPPLINGVRKPKKPGYKDSGADIAYVLVHHCGLDVVTPSSSPDPANDSDWVFGDTESGIISAVERKATHLWANTVLFANHPLQTSGKLDEVAKHLKIVGQPPKLVELYDDKNYVNGLLRAKGYFRLPPAQLVRNEQELEHVLSKRRPYPVVGKPVRGRGSHGVKVCRSNEDLLHHCKDLLSQQSSVIVEDYLPGIEGTVTVVPFKIDHQRGYYALPVVERFNHIDDIAPYSGAVAVMENSRVVTREEHERDLTYIDIQQQCMEVARELQVTAPIRIDVRRISKAKSSPFAMFDVNIKPNMTGPGRPGRENQASLTALAAAGDGSDYADLLLRILQGSSTLYDWRKVEPPK